MGNTLQSKSTTISTWYELNYNNNESKLSDNRRPAMGNIHIVINVYPKKNTCNMKPNIKMPIGTKSKAEHSHGDVSKNIHHVKL